MTSKSTKAPEARMIGKALALIEHLYPGIEEEARETFVHENEGAMKRVRRKIDFRLAFHAWFLLKLEFPSGATAMEMVDSFPGNYFPKKEKKMIKNFLNYKESLFEILEISEDKKDYKIKDLMDGKEYIIKTIDLPARFSGGDLIRAIIIKNIEGDYFFYGAVQTFDILNRVKFIKEMLKEIKRENTRRKKRKGVVVEWEIENRQTSKKEASQ